MSAERTLALFAVSTADEPTALEFLRILAALAACGVDVTLAEVGPGIGVLGDEEIADEAERYLEGLAAFETRPVALAGSALIEAIEACQRLLRIAPADRSREPALLILDDAALAEARADEAAFLDRLLSAGQVVRVPS